MVPFNTNTEIAKCFIEYTMQHYKLDWNKLTTDNIDYSPDVNEYLDGSYSVILGINKDTNDLCVVFGRDEETEKDFYDTTILLFSNNKNLIPSKQNITKIKTKIFDLLNIKFIVIKLFNIPIITKLKYYPLNLDTYYESKKIYRIRQAIRNHHIKTVKNFLHETNLSQPITTEYEFITKLQKDLGTLIKRYKFLSNVESFTITTRDFELDHRRAKLYCELKVPYKYRDTKTGQIITVKYNSVFPFYKRMKYDHNIYDNVYGCYVDCLMKIGQIFKQAINDDYFSLRYYHVRNVYDNASSVQTLEAEGINIFKYK